MKLVKEIVQRELTQISKSKKLPSTDVEQLKTKIAVLHSELDLFIAGDARFTWVYFSNKLKQLSI